MFFFIFLLSHSHCLNHHNHRLCLSFARPIPLHPTLPYAAPSSHAHMWSESDIVLFNGEKKKTPTQTYYFAWESDSNNNENNGKDSKDSVLFFHSFNKIFAKTLCFFYFLQHEYIFLLSFRFLYLKASSSKSLVSFISHYQFINDRSEWGAEKKSFYE